MIDGGVEVGAVADLDGHMQFDVTLKMDGEKSFVLHQWSGVRAMNSFKLARLNASPTIYSMERPRQVALDGGQ